MKRKEIQELIEAMPIEKQLHLWNMYCNATEQITEQIYPLEWETLKMQFIDVSDFVESFIDYIWHVNNDNLQQDLLDSSNKYFAINHATDEFNLIMESDIKIDTHAISELIKDEMFTLEPQKYKEEKNLTDFELFDEVLQRLI